MGGVVLGVLFISGFTLWYRKQKAADEEYEARLRKAASTDLHVSDSASGSFGARSVRSHRSRRTNDGASVASGSSRSTSRRHRSKRHSSRRSVDGDVEEQARQQQQQQQHQQLYDGTHPLRPEYFQPQYQRGGVPPPVPPVRIGNSPSPRRRASFTSPARVPARQASPLSSLSGSFPVVETEPDLMNCSASVMMEAAMRDRTSPGALAVPAALDSDAYSYDALVQDSYRRILSEQGIVSTGSQQPHNAVSDALHDKLDSQLRAAALAKARAEAQAKLLVDAQRKAEEHIQLQAEAVLSAQAVASAQLSAMQSAAAQLEAQLQAKAFAVAQADRLAAAQEKALTQAKMEMQANELLAAQSRAQALQAAAADAAAKVQSQAAQLAQAQQQYAPKFATASTPVVAIPAPPLSPPPQYLPNTLPQQALSPPYQATYPAVPYTQAVFAQPTASAVTAAPQYELHQQQRQGQQRRRSSGPQLAPVYEINPSQGSRRQPQFESHMLGPYKWNGDGAGGPDDTALDFPYPSLLGRRARSVTTKRKPSQRR